MSHHRLTTHDTRRSSNRGFSLVELIVVITIIVILLAVSVPAIRSTIASTSSSAAETSLRLAFVAARNAAINADSGQDAALVFFYEPGGRTSAVVCEYVATFNDNQVGPNSTNAGRDVFVPNPRFDPTTLPEGWMVRGLALVGQLGQDDTNNQPQAWYDGADKRGYDPGTRNWLFPETGFYDALVSDDGGDRQSFLIRFAGKTGEILYGDTREVLVVSPRPTVIGRDNLPGFDEGIRVDRGGDLAQVVRRAFGRDDWQGGLNNGNNSPLEQLFGDASGDTVLCRSVPQLALYKVTDLANGLAFRLDPDTGSVYKKAIDPQLSRTVNPKRAALIQDWIEGDTNGDGTVDAPIGEDRPVARLYTARRYSARLEPVPLLDLEGIQNGGRP